jgi:DNA-binding beta-propeller fold protein YncE
LGTIGRFTLWTNRTLVLPTLILGAIYLGSPTLPSANAAGKHVLQGSFGAEGSASGQFNGPMGLAVSEASKDVYVVDRGNNRVERFDAAGSFIGEFDGSLAPTGALSSPTAVAVDNSKEPLDPSAGDVYVVDAGHDAIDKFTPAGVLITQITEASPGSSFGELDGVAVDPAGQLWVYQASGEIDNFDDASLNGFVASRASPFGTGFGIAVDDADNLFVERGAFFVAKLNVAGETAIEAIGGEDESAEVTAFAVRAASGLSYLYRPHSETIVAFETAASTGNPVETISTVGVTASQGMAIDAETGTLYLANAGVDQIEIFREVLVPDLTTGPATDATESTATLTGTINPDAVALTSCEFEYGLTMAYGSTVPCSPSAGEIGASSAPVEVTAVIENLQARGVYHFRLVASNANGSSEGIDQTFAVPSRPVIVEDAVSSVTSSSAGISALINPGDLPTKYVVEYGLTSSYGASLPAGEGDIHEGLADVPISVYLEGLPAGTTYHFRIVAKNALGTTAGPDQTLRTQQAGASRGLPDGRAWELVSPSDKRPGVIQPLLPEGAIAQAAANGQAITYVTNESILSNPEGNSNLSQVLSRRGLGSWQTEALATPHERQTGQSVGRGSEYRFFSEDLGVAVVEPFGPATPLTPDVTERTIYTREAGGTYQALVTPANTPPGTQIGGEPNALTGAVHFVDATPDGSHVILASEGVALTEDATENGLYEWTAGQLRIVNVLPEDEGGTAVNGFLGFEGGGVRNALSTDGERAVWSSASERHLYLRDLVKGQSVRLDKDEVGGEAEGGSAVFQFANTATTKIFFTDSRRLTANSTSAGGGESDLYEFEVAAAPQLSGTLHDVTAEVENVGEAAAVQGVVLGGSDDGSDVYLVAKGILRASGENERHEKAVSGGNNLYEIQNEGSKWKPTFITTLADEDAREWEGESSGSPHSITARVSPDGRYLAFMSSRSLTGYDNRDVNSGAADEEVYLYDSARSRLLCASCNPTGQRPLGTFDSIETGLLVDPSGGGVIWPNRWLAANIPGWTAMDVTHALYQSRYLNDEGRLYFNSSDTLVPQDRNSTNDVYEYEPQGVGSCTPVDEAFLASLEGCVSLLSSGTASTESTFLDASESGSDVFFLTAEPLASQDHDDQFDVYDARECSDASPCIAAEGGPSEPCASPEACRSSIPPAAGAATSAPTASAMAAAGGPGRPAKSPSKPKIPTRAQKLAKALKQCRARYHWRKKRASCEAHARKLYRAGHKPARAKGRR